MTQNEKKEISQRESGIHHFRGFDEAQWTDIAEAQERLGVDSAQSRDIAATLKNMDDDDDVE